MTDFSGETLRKCSMRELRLDYLLGRPTLVEVEALPLVVYLHGAGEKGSDLDRVARTPFVRRLAGWSERRFWTACPQCPGERSGWRPDEIATLIEELVGTQRIDTDRVYLTGVSMGGRGVWEYAYEHGGRLAALAPLCGFGLPNLAPRLAGTPIWAFHGALDSVLPVERSDEMVVALKAAGGSVQYTRYPDLGHDCEDRTYGDPSFWAWLLDQRRSAGPTGRS